MFESLTSFITFIIMLAGVVAIARYIISPIIVAILDRKTDLYKNERKKTPLEERDLKTKGEKEDPFFLLTNIESEKMKKKRK